jgi:hypothetical protein
VNQRQDASTSNITKCHSIKLNPVSAHGQLAKLLFFSCETKDSKI